MGIVRLGNDGQSKFSDKQDLWSPVGTTVRTTTYNKLTSFDKLNWNYELLGNFSVETDGEKLRLIVLPQPQMGSFSSDNHKIMLGKIKKKDICNIDLDFENCECFMVFNNEIKEINLVFDKRLVLGSNRYTNHTLCYRRIYIFMAISKCCNMLKY